MLHHLKKKVVLNWNNLGANSDLIRNVHYLSSLNGVTLI